MRKFYLLFIGLLVTLGLNAQTIVVHDFETSDGYTRSQPDFTTGSDYVGRMTNDSITPDFTGFHGTYFFAAQDIDGQGGEPYDTTWIGPIDISSYDGAYIFKVLTGQAYASSNKWDANDFVHIDYSFDGTNYQPLIWLENDGSDYNAPTLLDTDFDGVGDSTIDLSSTMKDLTATLDLTGQSTLYIRIDLHLDAGSEDIALDYLRLEEPSTTPTLQSVEYYPDRLVLTYDAPLNTIDVNNYKVLSNGSEITFGNIANNDDSTQIYLSDPSTEFVGDATADSLVDLLTGDTMTFYAGIIPVNYFNSANSEVVPNGERVVVTGVVTADNNYKAIYIADGDGQLHGLYVFDASQTYPTQVEPGDSVVFIGSRTEYNGMTEFIPDSLFFVGTPSSLTINPVVVGADVLDIHQAANNPVTEPYEGVLVTVENLQCVSGPTGYYEYFLINGTDTVIVDDGLDYHYGDGLTLTPGHVYTITGLVNYSYGHYRLNPRGVDDVVDLTPSSVSAVYYPDNKINVVYSGRVFDVDPGNYVVHTSDGATITFGSCLANADSTVLSLSDFSGSFTADAVLDTLIDNYAGDTVLFYLGIIPINYFNTASPDVIENGYSVAVAGVVTADNDYKAIYIADGDGAYHGLYIYDPSQTYPAEVAPGDSVVFIGSRTEYNGMTEFVPDSLFFQGTPGSLTVNPVIVDANVLDIHQDTNSSVTEPYEGVLVTVENVQCVSGPTGYYEYYLVSGTDTIIVDDGLDYHYGDGLSLTEGQVYTITGLVNYSHGHYRLNPRGVDDVQEVVTNLDNARSVMIYPNPVENVLNLVGVQQVRIYDNSGRLVKQALVNNSGQIDLSGLASGVYLVKYVTTDGKLGVQKILKK